MPTPGRGDRRVPGPPGDAAGGARVRELESPRDALLNVIVRGEQAFPPRGSTRVEAGDRLHVLVRQEVAVEFEEITRRWREGPLHPTRRPRLVTRGATTIFSSGLWTDASGDPTHPGSVGESSRRSRCGPAAIARARSALADGRYAFTGPVFAVGSSTQIQDAARRRLRAAADDAEVAWWREVIGVLPPRSLDASATDLEDL